MLRILTTNYNTTPYIHKLIASLKAQSITEWKCYITDDLSTDGSVSYIQSLIENDSRFELIVNEKKFWQTGNYHQVLQKTEILDSDICITIDGDDFLYDNNVFQRVINYYSNHKIWMSFGQFVFYDGTPNLKIGFTKKPEPFSNVRKCAWTSSHLRTFKAFLFRKIAYVDLIDPKTNWFYKTAGDTVCFTPMLEMSGEDRVLYTNDVNYCYNIETNLNDYKVNGHEQNQTSFDVSNKLRYKRL